MYHFHILEEVFGEQGAPSLYSHELGQPLLSSNQEHEIEASIRATREKGTVCVDSSDENVQFVAPRRGKGKGKRKSGDSTACAIPQLKGSISERYTRMFDNFESLLSKQTQDSMSQSVGYPNPNAPPPTHGLQPTLMKGLCSS